MAGLIVAGGIVPLVALALLAGLGNALFRPATCALLPALVPARELAAANALYDALRNAGQLLGPAVAAALLLAAPAELVLGLNAATFAASALLLCPLRRAVRREPDAEAPASLLSRPAKACAPCSATRWRARSSRPPAPWSWSPG